MITHLIDLLIQFKQLLNDPFISTLANLLVAIGTIFLAVMAYKQIKEGRIVENVKNHSNDLKELLRQWNKSLPEITSSESVGNNFTFESAYLYSVENHPLYNDIKNHLPDGYKELFNKWNDFKEQISVYNDKKQKIFNNFTDYFDKESNTNFESGSIYARAVGLIKEESSLHITWDYYNMGEELRYGRMQVYYTLGWGDMKRIEENHTKISRQYSTKYDKEIRDVIEINRQLEKDRREISKNINDLTFYPSFPNMKCKHIKGAFK
jgi:hypothetical protein